MAGHIQGIPRSQRIMFPENVELMWLLRKLAPDFKTITDFRRGNGRAIREVCRQFTLLCRQWGLFGGELVAIGAGSGPRFELKTAPKVSNLRGSLQRSWDLQKEEK
jgi:hypothetical protein